MKSKITKLAGLQKYKWLAIGFIPVMIAAWNPTVVKYASSGVDVHAFNLVRYLAIVVFTLPYVIKNKHHFKNPSFKYVIIAGVSMATAVVCYTMAIDISQASYVQILNMLGPLVFMAYSSRMTKDKISRRAIIGIAVAFVGAMLVVLLPISLGHSTSFQFYPLATVLILINVIVYPFTVILSRRSHEQGIPMFFIVATFAWVVALASIAMYLIFSRDTPTAQLISPGFIAASLYSGLGVGLIARSLVIASYEKIGAAASSALAYFEGFLSILIAVIILNEKLSWVTVVGGTFILLGIFIIEFKFTKPRDNHHRHWHFFKHH